MDDAPIRCFKFESDGGFPNVYSSTQYLEQYIIVDFPARADQFDTSGSSLPNFHLPNTYYPLSLCSLLNVLLNSFGNGIHQCFPCRQGVLRQFNFTIHFLQDQLPRPDMGGIDQVYIIDSRRMAVLDHVCKIPLAFITKFKHK
jgi:hypothetical protein